MAKEVIVSVKEGKLRGIRKMSQFSGTEYYAFYAVPYGEPPINDSRFKDPIPAKPWKSIRNTTIENKTGCKQFSYYALSIIGSEDCLYNNIYTPQLPSEGEPLKPVIVCIHPGGFRFGGPETWHFGSPNYVIHHDIVYVCIGYRLHILGFLNLNLKECSGNQALKDIILSLKWIKKNIHKFNGDPNNVTLLGSSSGAITIELLMLSPATRGLFHKAVLSSYVFSPYSTFGGGNEEVAFHLASKVGFHTKDRRKLLKFLKGLSIERFLPLNREYENLFVKTIAPIYPQSVFLPTIDAASENPVIPIHPRKLIDSMMMIPIMYGDCDREAILGFSTKKLQKYTEQHYQKAYRQNKWGWMYELNDHEIRMINDEVEAYFFKDYPNGNVPLDVKEKMMSSVAGFDVYDTLLNPVAEKLPESVYVYKLSYDGDLIGIKTLVTKTMEGETVEGSYHSSEFSYWNCRDKSVSPEDADVIQTYTKLITTFARNGNPNYEQLGIEWRPYTIEHPCYLRINTNLEMVDNILVEGAELWERIKKQFKKD